MRPRRPLTRRALGPLPAGAPPDRAPRARAPRRAPGRPSARRLAGRAASRRAAARAGRALHLHLADVALLVDVVEPTVLALHATARDLLLALDRAPAPSGHARAAHVSPLVEEVEPSLLPADAGLRHDIGHSAFSCCSGSSRSGTRPREWRSVEERHDCSGVGSPTRRREHDPSAGSCQWDYARLGAILRVRPSAVGERLDPVEDPGLEAHALE